MRTAIVSVALAVAATLGLGAYAFAGTGSDTPTMHGNPSAPVPAGLANQGAYQLHDGDPLPPNVVYADPNTIFMPPCPATTPAPTDAVLPSTC